MTNTTDTRKIGLQTGKSGCSINPAFITVAATEIMSMTGSNAVFVDVEMVSEG
jgi:hypothetical protein